MILKELHYIRIFLFITKEKMSNSYIEVYKLMRNCSQGIQRHYFNKNISLDLYNHLMQRMGEINLIVSNDLNKESVKQIQQILNYIASKIENSIIQSTVY
jgi:hypothetical protein